MLVLQIADGALAALPYLLPRARTALKICASSMLKFYGNLPPKSEDLPCPFQTLIQGLTDWIKQGDKVCSAPIQAEILNTSQQGLIK